MNNYENAGDGLIQMYEATRNILIAMIAALALCWIPILSTIVFFIVAVVVLIYTIKSWIGLYSVSKDIPLCKIAFFLQIAGVLFSFVPVVGIIAGIAAVVSQLMIVVGVIKVLKEKEATSAIRWGRLSFVFTIIREVHMIVNIVLLIMIFVTTIEIPVVIASLVAFVGVCVAELVFYMMFLKRSGEELGAYVY